MRRLWNADLAKRFPTHAAALHRIEELEALQFSPRSLMPVSVAGLTVQTTCLVQAIARTGEASYDQLAVAVWGGDTDVDVFNNVRCRIVQARRALAPHDIAIRTVFNFGYAMDPASQARWNALVLATAGPGC